MGAPAGGGRDAARQDHHERGRVGRRLSPRPKSVGRAAEPGPVVRRVRRRRGRWSLLHGHGVRHRRAHPAPRPALGRPPRHGHPPARLPPPPDAAPPPPPPRPPPQPPPPPPPA